MTKEELIELGLTEDLAVKVAEKYKNLVPYERFQEVVTEKNNLKNIVSERDKQLDELKKIDVDGLKEQITTLQKENKVAKEKYDSELNEIKISNAIEKAITKANGKNVKAVKALLEVEKLELLEDGTLKGLDDQLNSLKGSEDTKFLFNITDTKPDVKGASPVESSGNSQGGNVDISKMSYDEFVQYHNSSN